MTVKATWLRIYAPKPEMARLRRSSADLFCDRLCLRKARWHLVLRFYGDDRHYRLCDRCLKPYRERYGKLLTRDGET